MNPRKKEKSKEEIQGKIRTVQPNKMLRSLLRRGSLSVIFIVFSILAGLQFMPAEGSSTIRAEENTFPDSESENISEENMLCSDEQGGVVLAPSCLYRVSNNRYESPVIPVLTGPPKLPV